MKTIATLSVGLALGFALIPTTMSQAASTGDAENGERLARRWCATCHLVAADQTRAAADAPSFAALATDPRRGPEGVADFLTLPSTTHSRMSDLSLSRSEIADLVAYIETLKK